MNGGKRYIKDYQKRGTELFDAFTTYRNHYSEIAEVMEVRKNKFLIDYDVANQYDMGIRQDQKITNSSSLYAVDVASAGFTAGLTPHSRKFFALTLSDPELMKWQPVQEYLDYLTDEVLKNYSLSNYYAMKQKYWRCGLVFGIASAFQQEQINPKGCSFDLFEVGEYQSARGAKGDINVSYRKYSVPCNNIVEEFGFDNCSETVRKAFERKQLDTRFLIHHVVQPNNAFDPYRRDADGKKWESVYYEDAQQQNNDKFLRIEGYRTKPFSSFCWDADGNQPYGNSRGMVGLGDATVLQALEEMNYDGIVLTQKPPYGIPSTLDVDNLDLSPLGENVYNPGQGNQKIEPLINYRHDHQGIILEIERVQNRFATIMYNNLFLSLINDGSPDPQKTAYEIAEKQREKLLMLGSAIEAGQRSIKEDVSRTIDILDNLEALRDPPEEISEMTLDVQCVGTLALAQKSVDVQSIQQLSGYIGQMAQIYPNITMKMNAEKCVEKLAEAQGLPANVLVSEQQYKTLVEYNNRQQQAMQQNENNMANVAGAKTLSDTNLDGNTALSSMVKQATGGNEAEFERE